MGINFYSLSLILINKKAGTYHVLKTLKEIYTQNMLDTGSEGLSTHL